MKIICIAPAAPPLNQPEPIQVFRIVQELLKTDHVDLVSEPVFGSWSRRDGALVLDNERLRRLEIGLPRHDLTMRLIGHRRLAGLAPLTDHWIAMKVRAVARWSGDFDIIYTRSFPTRAALLGARLKKMTGKPWVMHLSDPWTDNALNQLNSIGRLLADRDEHQSFALADQIAMTTAEQARFMASKYPAFAEKFFVTPNIVRDDAQRRATDPLPEGMVKMVFAGSLYGRNSIFPLLDALQLLPPSKRERLKLTVAGNVIPREADRLQNAGGGVRYLGLLPYEESLALQRGADLLVTLEPTREFPLDGTLLLSKLGDYLTTSKPILAITPSGSVMHHLIDGRFGWAVDPSDPAAIAKMIVRILDEPETFDEPIPAALTPTVAVGELRQVFEKLVS